MQARNGVLQSTLLEVAAQVGSRGLAQAQQVRTQAGNVGGGHGGARHGDVAAAGAGGHDLDAGGLDVDDVAVVGVAGGPVAAVDGADGADGGLRGRGDGGRVHGVVVLVAVARGDGHEEAPADQGRGGLVHGLRPAPSQAEVDDDAVGAVALRGVPGDVLDARDDDGRVGAALLLPVHVEHLDAVDGGLLGHADLSPADGARDVRAMEAVVVLVAYKGPEEMGAALKLLPGAVRRVPWGVVTGVLTGCAA